MENTKEFYDIQCPNCNKALKTVKSIGHEMGCLEAGMGSCPVCGMVMNITYDIENNTMATMDFKEWLKNKKEKGKR